MKKYQGLTLGTLCFSDGPMTGEGFATGDGVSIDWPPDSEVTCGYTVRWCLPPGSESCVIDWETFPSNVTHAVIKSGKKIKVISLYRCKCSILFPWKTAFANESANGGRGHSSVGRAHVQYTQAPNFHFSSANDLL